MRDIKFRTPTKCQNGHFRWYYYSVSFGEVKTKWGEKHPDCTCPTWDFKEGFQECGPDQQFTGQKDKNGKEIYEGDLLKYAEGSVGVVKYIMTGFYVARDDGCIYLYASASLENNYGVKVIGNIHENPELPEGK